MSGEIKEFKVTVRDQDLFDVYRSDFQYKLFAYENYARLSYIALFLILSIVSTFGDNYNRDLFLFTLLFLLGVGYNVIQLLADYWAKKKKQKEITVWINSIKKYSSHRLSLHSHFFKYLRDEETFVYDIHKTISLYHNQDYFYCKLDSGIDIVLPSKAFEKGEYLEFTTEIDKMKQ